MTGVTGPRIAEDILPQAGPEVRSHDELSRLACAWMTAELVVVMGLKDVEAEGAVVGDIRLAIAKEDSAVRG